MITGPLTDALIDAYDGYEHKRMRAMEDAFDCYAGRHPASLSIARDSPDDNIKVNYGRLVVNAGVQALVGSEPDFTFDPTRKGQSAAAPTAAWEAWVEGQKTFLLQLQKIATNGGQAGTAYYKLSTQPGRDPSIRVLDPRHVTCFWDPENVDDVWAYLIRWNQFGQDGKERARRQIVERASESSWLIRDEVAAKGTKGWKPLAPPVRWGYDWSPVGHCQNLPAASECYGEPDLPPDTIDLVYAINRVASNTNKIIRLHAHPKLIAFGIDARDIDISPDEMVTINNPEARVDTIAAIGDVVASLDFYRTLKEGLHETTRTPEVATGKMDSTGQLSGVALQILYGPQVAVTEQKQLTYGPMLEDLARKVLTLLGSPVTTVNIGWQNVAPVDRKAELEAAGLAQGLGASKATTLEEVGYDADRELAASDEENAAALEAGQRAMMAGQVVNYNARPLPDQGGDDTYQG